MQMNKMCRKSYPILQISYMQEIQTYTSYVLYITQTLTKHAYHAATLDARVEALDS